MTTTVFFSYAHADEVLRDRLDRHLAMLKRQRIIDVWHDRRLVPGEPIDASIAAELERSDLILLLVSPDFLASDYCYDREMQRALERHAAGEARVLPVILRPCDWHEAPFGHLLATPTDGKPITKFADLDDAFLEVTTAIRAALAGRARPPAPPASRSRAPAAAPAGPRSSNLRLTKSFTEADKDRFLDDAFAIYRRSSTPSVVGHALALGSGITFLSLPPNILFLLQLPSKNESLPRLRLLLWFVERLSQIAWCVGFAVWVTRA